MGLALQQKFVFLVNTLRNEWDLDEWPLEGHLAVALAAVGGNHLRDNWKIFGH